MSFMSFNERGTKDIVLHNVINNSNYIGLFLIGCAMIFFSVRYVFPNDLFTSALFFDGLKLQQVFTSPAKAFAEGGIWEELPDLTTEAFAFAVSLSLSQVFFGYKYAAASGDSLFTAVSGLYKGKKVNFGKLSWFAMYMFVACFDTWTDTEYRSFYGQQGLYIRALLVSFIFYNLASEYFIVQGFHLIINYGIVLKNNLFKDNGIDPKQQVPQQKTQRGGGGEKQQNKNGVSNNDNNNGNGGGRIHRPQNGRPAQVNDTEFANFPPPVNRQGRENPGVRQINRGDDDGLPL